MSIAIAAFLPNHLIVAADTAGFGANGLGQYPKLFPLAHLNGVLAVRGPARLVATVALEAGLSGLSFDDLAAELPHIIDRVGSGASEHLAALPTDRQQFELFFAGWPEGRPRPALWSYTQPRVGAKVEATLWEADDTGAPGICAPWAERLGPMPTTADLATSDGLIAVARRQVQLMNEHFGGRAAGGELISARIFADGMVIERAGELDAEPVISGGELVA